MAIFHNTSNTSYIKEIHKVYASENWETILYIKEIHKDANVQSLWLCKVDNLFRLQNQSLSRLEAYLRNDPNKSLKPNEWMTVSINQQQT